ncbi:hypothetical protein [Microvirga aerophila]|uniref:hypothetical protein n=1 Tax=Microvirga aerophila TaxID=670291 RepID=UPI0011BEABBD|nr:hypothetical protein [Microvirga aerophila]
MSSLLGLLAIGSTALAQTDRPWVDPPGEGGAAPQTGAPSPSQSAVPPAAPSTPSPATESTASNPVKAAPVDARESPRESKRAEPPTRKKATSVARTRSTPKVVTERPNRQTPRKAIAARSKPQVVTADRIGAGRQRLVGRPLEVMTLRTIEFPDGRRMNVLVRPGEERIQEVVGDLY